MNQNQRARLEQVELWVTRNTPRPGFAIVHCELGEQWDALSGHERARRIEAELGRPGRPDDVVIVMSVVDKGSR
jgi:hypothetical protein